MRKMRLFFWPVRGFSGLLLPFCLSIGGQVINFAIAGARTPELQERTYEIDQRTFPRGVIEIQEVLNLQSTHFPADLEIKVKNISGRPVFGIHLMMYPEFQTTV